MTPCRYSLTADPNSAPSDTLTTTARPDSVPKSTPTVYVSPKLSVAIPLLLVDTWPKTFSGMYRRRFVSVKA
jgi:hypothetical protein